MEILETQRESGSDVRRYPKAVPYGQGRAERIDQLIVGPGISAHDAVEFFLQVPLYMLPQSFCRMRWKQLRSSKVNISRWSPMEESISGSSKI